MSIYRYILYDKLSLYLLTKFLVIKVSVSKLTSLFSLNKFVLFFCLCLLSNNLYAETDDSAFGITNFAFSSYLGTGFYSTSGQDVFVFQLPLQHVIKEKTDTEAGWVLNLPLTFGFINFSGIELDVENVPDLNDVGTLTFLPGIEYQYPATKDWTVIPFADYGFARDLNHTTNVLIIGIGVKNYIEFKNENNVVTVGNKILYARERTEKSSNDSDYSLIETGINYSVKSDFNFNNRPLYSNLYYINFYYPNNLVFLERTPTPIKVGIEHEVGITFSNMPDFLFFEKPQIGLGVRLGNNVKVYRLLFGMPF